MALLIGKYYVLLFNNVNEAPQRCACTDDLTEAKALLNGIWDNRNPEVIVLVTKDPFSILESRVQEAVQGNGWVLGVYDWVVRMTE